MASRETGGGKVMSTKLSSTVELTDDRNMNQRTQRKWMVAIAMSLIQVLALASLAGCSKKKSGSASVSGGLGGMSIGSAESATNSGKQLYQCSMHPNIISDHPGKCPICAMDLQPVSQIKAEGIPGRGAVQLSSLQQQLINIRVTPVVSAPASKTIRAVGIITYDETKVADVNSRVMGWVDRLFVDKPGEFVKANQPLMALYSPDLYSAQEEYLLAFQQAQDLAKESSRPESDQLKQFTEVNRQGAESLLKAARKRLELWDISEAQIKALETSRNASNTLELVAPVSGFVVKKNVYPKQMIQAGMVLYRIADLSTLWLDADVYEYELPFIKVGQSAIVTVDAYPGRTFTGKVDFIYPYLENKTRTAKVRLVFDNADHLLKPEMYGNVVIAEDLGEQLLVPASAVFDTGKRQYLFVQQAPGVFVPKEIQLGPKTDDHFVVKSGVNAGDKVVVDGNFLLDSESQLKAAASVPTETNAPAASETTNALALLPSGAGGLYAPLVANYLQVQQMFVHDKTDGLPSLARKMSGEIQQITDSPIQPAQEAASYHEQLASLEHALGMLDTNDLQAARIQFGNVSAELIALLKKYSPPLNQPLTVVFCPMWNKSPAQWLQQGQDVGNPFMGQKMPGCGEVKGTIGGRQ
jgi:membrane fusion protein, copper/silver efflux system